MASSNSVVSTFLAAILTYRTTEPRMKQFLMASYMISPSTLRVLPMSLIAR